MPKPKHLKKCNCCFENFKQEYKQQTICKECKEALELEESIEDEDEYEYSKYEEDG